MRIKSNKKTVLWKGKEYTFDSALEADRAAFLFTLCDTGAIQELELQPRFLLIDKFKTAGGANIRKMEYTPDFKYIERGITVIEEIKGFATPLYKMRKKVFLHIVKPQCFREVTRKRGNWHIKQY